MKNVLMAIMIVVALVIFVIFWDSPPEVFLNKDKTPEATLPTANSYMINSETQNFDEQGRQSFVLKTSRGQFFKNLNRFIMDKPRMRADGDMSEQLPWHMSANSGVVFDRATRVVLRGKVRAWQVAPTGNTELNTSALTLYPDSNIVETDRKVTLRSPGTRISGIGMKANLEQQLFQLLSKVKSKHHAAN
jgi:lipopolysaccharide export system protein LptC